MKQARSPLPHTLRRLALGVLLVAGLGTAQADDYAEVTQLLKAGRASDALVLLDKRLASNPRDPQLRFLRGVAQTDMGRAADAVTTFTQLTEEYPELPEPYNNLAVLYAQQNQLDRARTALEMAIRTNPSYATAHENLGDVYARLASQAYQRSVQLDGSQAASVQPKLALMRELFAIGSKPRTSAARASAPAAPSAPASR